MARPTKTSVDYFPHMTHSGKTIAILEARWGNDGYAFWFKLLELLGDSSDFSFNCSRSADWEYLLSKTRVTEPVARAILDKLAEVEAIDAACWQQNIVWSDNFCRNLEPVFEKRKGQKPQKPEFPQQKPGSGDISGDFRNGNPAAATIIPTETDKEKDSREEDSKAEKSTVEKESESAAAPGRTKDCPSARRSGVVRQADTVYLKPAERERLDQDFGEQGAARIIFLLDAYKSNYPRRCCGYSDDYKVIQSWVINRYREESSGSRLSPGGPRTFMDRLEDMVHEDAK